MWILSAIKFLFLTKDVLHFCTDQILVGSLNGNIVIVDPGKDVENRREVAVLIEKRLPHSILQIQVGRFLASYDENLLAVLHPKILAFYRLNSGENHLLDRQLITAIHPGPIVYAPTSKCLYNASGGFLSCYPFHSFTSTTGNQQKRLNSDWSFNLGDTAIDIADMDIAPIQPSILVLCKRNLYCVTHGGTPRFIIRLQAVATSLLVYKTTNDPLVQLCIGTATKTLLFYRDTTMVWSAQLDVIPVALLLSSFSDILSGMIAVLSDECKLVIGYLGTEPSLFRMPLTETRFIDFEQRRKEMEQFERSIKQNSKDGGGGSLETGLQLSVSVEMDSSSMAYDTFDNLPSATVTVRVGASAQRVDLVIQSEAFAHNQFFGLSSAEYGNLPITMFVRGHPVRDPRFRLAATTTGGECAMHDSNLPLRLLCQEVGAQRNAQVKLSVDSTGPGFTIADLYPDFDPENQTSLGLQPYGSGAIVSVFSAGRYRIQSDSTEFLFLIFDDLIRRIRKRQPDARLNSPVPLHLFVTAIGEHVELEKRRSAQLTDMERISIQMRHVETVLLNKLKAERDETMTPINVLINYTYRELLTSMDRLRVTEEQLERHKNETLKPLLNLMQLIMQLSGINVPFDGRMLDGTEQTLAQRLAPLLGGSSAFGRDVDGAELTRLLVSFCEQGGRLSGIAEALNEEEDGGEAEELKNPPGQELVSLESGALPLGSDMLDLLEQN